MNVPKLRFKEFDGEWEEQKLGDITEKIGSGKTPKGGKATYQTEGIALIRSQNIFNDQVNSNDIAYISTETDESMKNSRVFNGDILLNITGASIGRSAVYKKDVIANVNQHVCIIRPKKDYSSDFIQLNISSNKGQKEIEFNQAGGGREGLNFQQIAKMKFNYPSIKEQNKISLLFEKLNKKIQLQQQKIDLLQEQKKGFLQKMFPKAGETQPEMRFDGFAGDWKQYKLTDVKDTKDKYSYTGGPFGSDLKSTDYTKEGVRIVQLQNIGDGVFLNNYKIYTSEQKADSLKSNFIYPGEIIIAKMADPLARATIMPNIDNKYLMASDGIRLKVDQGKFDVYYILTLINSDVFRKEALNNSTGTTRKRIGLVTLGNLPMIIPSYEEQKKIGNFFKKLDKDILFQQKKLELLKDQKQGFMQQMFI